MKLIQYSESDDTPITFPPFTNGGPIEAYRLDRLYIWGPFKFPPFTNGGPIEAKASTTTTPTAITYFRRSLTAAPLKRNIVLTPDHIICRISAVH